MNPKISIIAAVQTDGGIGFQNRLPWNIPADLKRFKKLTEGHPVVMGWNTFDSIVNRLGKPLPNRTNIVITNRHEADVQAFVKDWNDKGVEIPSVLSFPNLPAALDAFKSEELFIIGGQRIFEEALPHSSHLYLTEVDATEPTDVKFPEFDRSQFKIESVEESPEGQTPPYKFVNYVRI